MEEKKPSVIESPNATTDAASGRLTSSAERKNHEVVECGNASPSRSAVWSPAPGSVRKDVANDAACHVIGPLVPFTYSDTAKWRVVRVAIRSRTGSLSNSWPAGTVADGLPENV